MFLAAALLVSYPAAASAQNSSVTKENALGNVRVSSIPGWFEFVSEQYRFRILFPGAPQHDNDVASMKGFKVTNASGHWAAWCSDLGREAPNEESILRSAYQRTIETMTSHRTSLFVSGDVFLNGRLGAELIIDEGGRTSYVRAFIFGRKLYTLSVTRKKGSPGGNTLPSDVRQFFDSFTYWD